MTEILSQEFLQKTMLTEWFVANQRHPDARNLTYCDFPSSRRWNEKTRTWEKRKKDTGKIGRIYFVHPSCGERYYLRMLLLVVKGAQIYELLRTYNGNIYPTFKEACNARALLSNDQEWHSSFDEAACWATSNQLRHLFFRMLLFCEVGDEHVFFEKVWRLLADDIQYNMHRVLSHETYQMSDTDLQDQLLEATAKEDEMEPSWIEIPDEFLLKISNDKIECMFNVVYSDLKNGYMDTDYLRERAILTLTNDIADTINNYIVSLVLTDEK
jgi:hypothetical protein